MVSGDTDHKKGCDNKSLSLAMPVGVLTVVPVMVTVAVTVTVTVAVQNSKPIETSVPVGQ